MKILSAIMGALARTPEFVPMCIFPALILAVCLLHTFLGMRKLYYFEGVGVSLFGAVLIACRTDARAALVAGGLLLLWTGLLRSPCPRPPSCAASRSPCALPRTAVCASPMPKNCSPA